MAFGKHSVKGYNLHSSWQLQDILTEAPVIAENLKHALNITEGPLVIADYGSSEGFNSMTLFRNVIETFRKESDRPVHVNHIDLPDNDWGVLTNLINTSENSYLRLPNTSFSVIEKSFYEQVLPSDSVHAGFSGFTFQYLDSRPEDDETDIPLAGPVQGWDATGPSAATERSTARVRKDLRILLGHRINELAVGGTLTIIATSPDLEGHSYDTKAIFIDPFVQAVSKGIISEADAKKMHPHIHTINLSDWHATLAHFHHRIEVLKLEPVKSYSPFHAKFVEDGDFEKFREALSGTIFVITRVQIYHNLSGTEEEKERVLEAYREEIKNAIKPEFSNFHWAFTAVTIRKTH
jgi:salicylate 1-O-methyltransferase